MKRPLKIGAYCGLALIIIGIISNLITLVIDMRSINNVFLDNFLILVGWVEILLLIFFTYSFVVLGKKFKNRLLVVMSWIIIVLLILTLVFNIFTSVVDMIPKASAATGDASQSIENLLANANPGAGSLQNLTPEQEQIALLAYMIAWAIMTIILGVITILFGVGLLNLGEKVKYSKVSGILNIVAGATYIIIIGFVVELVAFIFQAMLLLNASKNLEK